MPASILKHSRLVAGLTQRQLADRLGVSQAAVAQLERPNSNPRLATLERALAATGHRLELRAPRATPQVDETLLREALAMTPAQRLAAADQLLRDAELIAASRK